MKLIDDNGRALWDDEIDRIRVSREVVVCSDPDQIRLINRVLDLIENLHRRLEKLERS
jgi:hypothetical protein